MTTANTHNQGDPKRKLLSEKLMDLGNLIAAGIAFGRAFAPEVIDIELLGFGVGLAIWFYAIAWYTWPEK